MALSGMEVDVSMSFSARSAEHATDHVATGNHLSTHRKLTRVTSVTYWHIEQYSKKDSE